MADRKPETNAEGTPQSGGEALRVFVRTYRTLVIYWGLVVLGSVATFVAVFVRIGFFGDEHDLWAIADGLTVGVVSMGLILLAAASLQGWLIWLRAPEARDQPVGRSHLQRALGPVLTELEAARLAAGRRIRCRAVWMTPVGFAAGLALYFLSVDDDDLRLLALYTGGGALAGQMLATFKLAGEYERLYKRRVLSQLAALFGPLTYERPPRPDLGRLRRFHVFRHFTFAHAEDAIVGEYRGLKVRIVQLRLERLHYLDLELVFRGLLVEIGLKDRLIGTTAVTADAGAFGNLRDELAARNIRRVGLESPAFEHAYEVYATDQVTARALLTPDFMERFMTLGRTSGFDRPLALAQDNLLLLVMPRSLGHPDFFAAPGYGDPASDEAVLRSLYHDIEAVLGAVDAVIALDDATNHQSSPPPRRGRRTARTA